jgi:hypothetical protein
MLSLGSNNVLACIVKIHNLLGIFKINSKYRDCNRNKKKKKTQ